MFSDAFHWGCLASLRRTKHDHGRIMTVCMFIARVCLYLYDKHLPNPAPSYCARSRSMVCLMTASLAPWRRPCRPLIPFISSICSSSESNLWRYLNTHEKTQAQRCCNTRTSHTFYMLTFWCEWQKQTFRWFHRHLFLCKQSSLDSAVLETTTASHLRDKRQITQRERSLMESCFIFTASDYVRYEW